ncbi:MAG: tetratricopeptide repeat protein [bacterium]|nr:tetratricopeptide repeat protein [bacterium]
MKRKFLKLCVIMVIMLVPINLAAQTSIKEMEQKLKEADTEKKADILNELIEANKEKNPEKSIGYALEALKVFQETSEEEALRKTLVVLGDLYYKCKEYALAEDSYKNGLELSVSNDNPESVKDIQSKLGRLYRRIGDFKNAIDYYTEVLDYYQKTDDEYNTANIYERLGIINSRTSEYQAALDHFKRSHEIREMLGDRKAIAKSLNNMGIVYWKIRDSDNAIDFYFRSLMIKEEFGDLKGVASTYTNIGIVYRYMGDYTKALECYNHSLKIKDQLGIVEGRTISLNYNNIGIVYWNMGDYDKALEYYNMALEMERERGDKLSIARSLNNISVVYKEIEEYSRAREYLAESLQIREELGDRNGIASVLNNMAFVNIEQKRTEGTLNCINRSIEIARSINGKDLIRNNYRAYMLYYDMVEDYRNAFDYSKRFFMLNDSLTSESTQVLINNLHVKYDVEKKDNDIALLTEKKESQSFIIKLLVGFLLGFFILSLVIMKIHIERTKISNLLNTLIKNLPHPFYIVDAKDYSIDYSNSALTGEYLSNINRHTLQDPAHTEPVDEPKFIRTANIDKVVRTKIVQVTEFSFNDKDGQPHYFEAHGFPVINNIGDVEKIIEYGFDITERKLSDEKYHDLQKQFYKTARLAAIGKLSASVAHEINNPLQAIVDNIEYVEYALEDDFSETNSLQQVKIGVDRITKTVQRLLDINRPKVDAKECVSINETISSAISLLHNQFKNRNIDVKKVLCKEMTDVFAIQQELFQVFLNLFLNAIEAMIEGGVLTVITTSRNEQIEILIKDTGIGIHEKNIDRIFEPFFTTKTEMLGMGLGLTTTMSIIESFKGKIEVESIFELGTTFRISFESFKEVV